MDGLDVVWLFDYEKIISAADICRSKTKDYKPYYIINNILSVEVTGQYIGTFIAIFIAYLACGFLENKGDFVVDVFFFFGLLSKYMLNWICFENVHMSIGTTEHLQTFLSMHNTVDF